MAGRLIQKQKLRLAVKRPRQHQTLALPAGESAAPVARQNLFMVWP